MKSPIKFTIAALALGLAIPASRAQDTGTPPPPPPGEQGGKHDSAHKGPRGDRFKMLVEKLNLTDDQKAKIKPILEDEMKAIKAIRDDASIEREAKWTKIRDVVQSHNTQIIPLLTPEQQKKLEELKEERGPGGPGGPGGPRKPKE